MVIDVSGIHYVRVDPEAETAAIGGGASFGQVYAELNLHGLHLPGGGCETVCVGGYMQGGGYSFTSQMFGMNCDNVTGVQVALADGRIVAANADENQDLFWAVRGGTGNNFGVVLEIQYRLRKLGQLWGFGFKWPLGTDEQADAAIRAVDVWQKHFTGAAVPEKLSNQSLLVFTKEDDESDSNRPCLVIRGMFNGSEADCRKALEPLLTQVPDAERHRDIWRQGSYTELNEYLLNYPTGMPHDVPMSARSIAKSHIADRHLDPAEWRRLVDFFRNSPSSDNFMGLEAYGGAINAVEPDATAFWHRTGTMDMFLYSFWINEADRDEAESYLKEFDSVAGPLSNGHSYQNYPNPDNVDFGKMYFGGNLPRLVEVKKKYDPDNLFDFQQGLLNA
ncbi:MAG: FAD-binding protein [Burkholderiales bacterium]|nr:FAD-binding protein [Burkholderiales bacterium]